MTTKTDPTCIYCQGDAFSGAPCLELMRRTGHKASCLTVAEASLIKRREKRRLARLLDDVRNSPRAERSRSGRASIWTEEAS